LRYRIVRNLCLILICSFILQNGIQTWIRYLLEPPLYLANPYIEKKVEDSPKNQVALKKVNTQTILTENIFGGNKQAPQKDSKDSLVDLDRIPLAKNLKELVLIGTIVSSDQKNLAIISNKKERKPPHIVCQGERIKNILLKKILRNNVVVSIGDKEKVLSIDYKARNLLDQKPNLQQERQLDSEVEQQTFSVKRKYVLQSLSNIKNLFQQVRILPYMKQGKPQGFQIDQIKKKSFFDKIHLQNGDVLIKAENQPLDSVQQIWDLTKRIQNKDQVSLQVLRNNKKITHKYNLK